MVSESQPLNPPRPRFKKWLIAALLIALSLISLLVIPPLFNINTYRGQIASQIEQKLGRQITLGSLSLRLLPSVKITARDVSISDDQKFSQGAFIKAQSAKFDIRLGSLLKGAPEVRGIELTEPEVTLIKEKTGEWNWNTLKPLQPAGPGLITGSMSVAVHHGRLLLIDRSRAVVAENTSPIDLDISDLNLNFDQAAVIASPFRITLDKQTVLEVTKLNLLNHGEQRAQIEASLQNASLDELLKLAERVGVHSGFTGTGSITLKATIDADTSQRGPASKIAVHGAINEAQLQMPQLKQPLTINGADLNYDGDNLRLENLRAQFAGSHFTGWAQLKNFDHPTASFDLQADQLNINELQQLIAENEVSVGKSDKPQTSGAGSLFASGKLKVGRVTMDKFDVTNLQSQVNLKEQVVDLNPMTAGFCGGQYQGQVRINQSAGNSSIDLNGHFGGVNVNQFLSSMSSRKSDIYGHASGTLNIHSRAKQFDLNSTSGQGYVQIADGRITSFDLIRQIQALGKLAGLSSSGTGTDFRSLSTSLRFSSGRVYTDNLRMDMSQMIVTGRGVLLLSDPVMTNHELLAQLSSAKQSESLTSSIGGFFMSQAKLGVPLKMSGPITNPTFALNPKGLSNRLTDQIFKQQDESIKGVLDLFTNKKGKKH